MRFLRIITRAVLLVFLLESCRPANLKDYDKPYVDFDSLINTQLKKVSPFADSIRKISRLGAKKDTAMIKSDSTLLSREWEVFRQLDLINKPIYKGNYKIEEGSDVRSNLRVRSYTFNANPTSKSPVPYIRFYYQSNFNNLKRIESEYEQQDALYHTKRKLNIFFDNASGENLIYYYTIEGAQKMILSDSVKLSIQGTLIF
jgi:hypothetical protein